MIDLRLRRLKSTGPDLAAICEQLNAADWEASIKDFSETALRDFLSDPNHFYLLGYEGDEIAGAIHGCDKAWLGTEHDNAAAIGLYQGLTPTEREDGPTFIWKITK